MRILMYHYVKDKKGLPNRGYLELKSFQKQINFFEYNNKILNCENFLENLNENKGEFEKDDLLLTFDDGLKCHYDYVLPLLIKKKINAIFFIPTKILLENKILKVHKIHILLSLCSQNDLLKEILNHKSNENYSQYSKITYYNQEENSEKLIKNYLNYDLNSAVSEDFVDYLFNKYTDINENELFQKIYLNYEEVVNLSKNNMFIGSHSHNHRLLSKEKGSDIKIDISKSFEIIQTFTKYKIFCFPYGGKISYNDETLDALKDSSVDLAFSVENKEFSSLNDFSKFEIPRLDCNNFKHGKAYF